MPRPNDEIRREKELNDLREALKSPACRRIVNRMLSGFNLLGQSYAPGDMLATAYNEGVRASARWLMGELEQAEPGATLALLKEAQEERT